MNCVFQNRRCMHCGRVVKSDSVQANCRARRTVILGPGHCLTQLLSPISNAAAWLRIEGTCNCHKHAAEMDRNGVEWCEVNIETIVGWLREGAEKHGLPFSAMVARWFINRAIQQAKQ